MLGAATGGAELDAPSGTVVCATEPGVDTYAPNLKKPGTSGSYSFELVSSTPAPPALDDNTFVVRVTGADGTPQNGQLTAILDMPEHGHTSPKTPVITFDANAGAFTLNPMYLFMVGLWRITLTFQADAADGTMASVAGASGVEGGTDSVVFEFCVN
jgi:hypothetical protein